MCCQRTTPSASFFVCWLAPFGIVKCLVVDRDVAFEGVLMESCRALGVDVRYVPPCAHWQLGLAESGHYAWRRVCGQVPVTPVRVDLDAVATARAANQFVRRAGRAAYTAAFG